VTEPPIVVGKRDQKEGRRKWEGGREEIRKRR